MNTICPAIMAANPLFLRKTLRLLERLGISCLHGDILDGIFAPYISLGQKFYEYIAQETYIPLEIHFQVHDPLAQAKQLNNSLFQRLIFHIEKIQTYNWQDITAISGKCKIGIAINPETSIETLKPLLDYIDKIVVMASAPGRSQVEESAFDKIHHISSTLREYNKYKLIKIQVDAGVRLTNISKFKAAGADEFVCASALFNNQNSITNNYKLLMKKLKE